MSVAVLETWYTVLAAAATGAGATGVFTPSAPSQAAAPYVVYGFVGSPGPAGDVYGGTYQDSDKYQVACVATTQLDAETLADAIGNALHATNPSGTVQIRREGRVPFGAPRPDQTLFVAAHYYRVLYIGGQ